jgi:hypothetical protein
MNTNKVARDAHYDTKREALRSHYVMLGMSYDEATHYIFKELYATEIDDEIEAFDLFYDTTAPA